MDKLSITIGRLVYTALLLLLLLPLEIPLKSLINYCAFVCILFMTPFIAFTFSKEKEYKDSWQSFRQ